jgi:hypothetical protein
MFNRLSRFCVTVSVALAASVALSSPSFAQSPPPYTINVGPIIAEAGKSRTLVISGIWPNGCIPQSAAINTFGSGGLSDVVISLTVPPPNAPCTLATQPFSVSTTITPDKTGVQKLTAVTTNGQFVARGEVVTSSLTAQRALFDVSGLWYNPAVPGWGLSFTHQHTGSGAAFGTWYVYRADGSGSPKWYTLQDIKWDVPLLRGGVATEPVPLAQSMTATVYESIGGECPLAPFLIEACLVQPKEVKNVGRMTITFTSRETGSIAIERPPALLFQTLGPIQRIAF